MIHSILQILVFQVLFLAVYDLFLKKETFFSLNRIYLLLTPVLGFILPFLSFSFIQRSIPQEYIFQLPAVIVGGNASETIVNGTSLWMTGLMSLWLFGIAISTLFFIWKLYKISKLKSAGTLKNLQDYKLIILPNTDTAFSFFNTIYIGENLSEENKTSIIVHEKMHILHKHSLDLLFFEILRIIFWFNPLVYVFQSRMTTLHEFIADAEVTAKKDKKQYYQNLLSEVFQTEKISFINTFFNHSLIKKRIIMLQKSKSSKTAQLKYLLLLPIICGMLVYTSCSEDPKSKETQTNQQSDSEVMERIIAEEEEAIKSSTNDAKSGAEVHTFKVERLDDTLNENDLSVPFAAIEKVPVFPGCTGADNEAMKKCMSMKISQFINDNFNIAIANDLDVSGAQRIATQFKIDKNGRIVDVRASSLSHTPELEAEAIRVVKLLPQMQPGEQKGKKVGVLYSLPIVFKVVE